jgi:hypothetical protein
MEGLCTAKCGVLRAQIIVQAGCCRCPFGRVKDNYGRGEDGLEFRKNLAGIMLVQVLQPGNDAPYLQGL